MGASCASAGESVKRALLGKYNSIEQAFHHMFPCVRSRMNVVVLDILNDNFLASPAVNGSSTAVFRKPRIPRTPTKKVSK
jgi:hypothetical protein